MNKTILCAALIGVFAGTAMVDAASFKAELKMPGGRSWKGNVVERDGDWIVFSTGEGRPIRIGAGTIDELVFEVKLDEEKLTEMIREREYEGVISTLNQVLSPYIGYGDIRSNLTKYNALLMELYYKTANYDKSIELATKIAEDDRDLALQSNGQVHLVLSLIASEQIEKAKKMLADYGWSDLGADAKPQELYVAAKLFVSEEKYAEAMELVAKIVAFNSQDPEWMQPAELLCAEVYTELKMFDSAEEVIRQISLLYKNTNEDDKAQLLKSRIETLRGENEANESE